MCKCDLCKLNTQLKGGDTPLTATKEMLDRIQDVASDTDSDFSQCKGVIKKITRAKCSRRFSNNAHSYTSTSGRYSDGDRVYSSSCVWLVISGLKIRPQLVT